ncbi:hypothetical protein N0V93_005313 [Gnomoniopsis smithogilvyi]|uniref:Uncharacterized protein n=1 Tax=Gnomoniopsis smithogilvyi TaxID=1191159 RepID=A0A9W8YU51_9PEZI|nr:hypothetical protein N0V93_005313 [Gnomoniopsis smithogilvyi]
MSLIKAEKDNAMVIATFGAVPGVDLVMWTIRWGCYIAECGIACFWSFTLCQAVYGWRDDIRFRKPLILISEAGKLFSIFAAVFTMCLLQLESLQRNLFWWNFVLNFFYCGFCVGGLANFFLMFIEYFQTRRLFRRMNSQQRRDYERQPSPVKNRSRSDSTATSMITVGRVPTSKHFGALAQRKGGIYDKYLIARTFIPCVALCLFEVDNILLILGQSRADNIQVVANSTSPDLSASTAQAYFASFIPGCLASLVLALAFGTTRQYRNRLRNIFVSRQWQQSNGRRHRYGQSKEYKYKAMDTDNGILSRQKRLSMEKRLRIEVTYEFEIRNESAGTNASNEEEKPSRGSIRKGESSTFPYSVESHRWNDTATILPRKPSASVLMRGQS